MSDFISRQAAIDSIEKHLKFGDELYPLTDTDKILNHGFAIAASCVYNLPSAQPQRMRGKWINVTKTGGAELWKCSECGELELEDSYYCPNCGADMRGDEDE